MPDESGYDKSMSEAEQIPPSPEQPSPGSQATSEAARRAREAAQRAGQVTRRVMDEVGPRARPYLDRAWRNARIWIPFLGTPSFRARQVTYGARENRDGVSWNVVLPQRCWNCSAIEGLHSREYDFDERSFESPVGILAVTIGLAFFLLLLTFLWWKFIFLAFAALVGGAVLAYVKSWPEQVRVIVWTCDAHAGELRSPDAVVHENELHLLLPSASLAEAARSELAARRRAAGRHGQGTTETTDPMLSQQARPASEPSSAPAPAPYKRDELPPIKLD